MRIAVAVLTSFAFVLLSACTSEEGVDKHIEKGDQPDAMHKAADDEPMEDESAKDEPMEDESAKDEPMEDESAKDEPMEDESAKDEPMEDESAKDEPMEDESAEDKPMEDESAKDEPMEDESAEDKPAKDESAKDKPVKGKEKETGKSSAANKMKWEAVVFKEPAAAPEMLGMFPSRGACNKAAMKYINEKGYKNASHSCSR